MEPALRLLLAFTAIAAPTVLYLGLSRGPARLREDLLLALGERDDASDDASSGAARRFETGPTRPDDRRAVEADDPAPTPDSFVCSTCGAANMTGARFCRDCLGELNR